jgi:copper transport protein
MVSLEASVAALSYITLAVVLGQLVAAGFLLPDGAPKNLRRSLVAGASAALFIFLAIALAALVIQGAKLQRGFPTAELLWRYGTIAQSGKIWLAREFYGALLAIFLWMLVSKDTGRKLIRYAAILAIPLIASRSLTSHAVAVPDDVWLAVSADSFHLLATALWSGGLFALWRVLRFTSKESSQHVAWTVATVQHFSSLALVSVTLLVLTGVYQSWLHVGSLTTLVNTDYGQTLLLKLFLFGAMLSIGALNFLSSRKILRRAAELNEISLPGGAKVLRRIGIESLFGLLVFCATGLLTVLPPGVHAVHQQISAQPLSPPTKEKRYLPANGAKVKIIEPKSGQVFTSDQVPLNYTLSAGRRGHHVHAYVDGELMGMFESRTGTLNGVKSGRHVLELRVVAEDHQSELDASDRVQFIVK